MKKDIVSAIGLDEIYKFLETFFPFRNRMSIEKFIEASPTTPEGSWYIRMPIVHHTWLKELYYKFICSRVPKSAIIGFSDKGNLMVDKRLFFDPNIKPGLKNFLFNHGYRIKALLRKYPWLLHSKVKVSNGYIQRRVSGLNPSDLPKGYKLVTFINRDRFVNKLNWYNPMIKRIYQYVDEIGEGDAAKVISAQNPGLHFYLTSEDKDGNVMLISDDPTAKIAATFHGHDFKTVSCFEVGSGYHGDSVFSIARNRNILIAHKFSPDGRQLARVFLYMDPANPLSYMRGRMYGRKNFNKPFKKFVKRSMARILGIKKLQSSAEFKDLAGGQYAISDIHVRRFKSSRSENRIFGSWRGYDDLYSGTGWFVIHYQDGKKPKIWGYTHLGSDLRSDLVRSDN